MLDSLKNKNKFGFSMFEVCVTMAIVAIFIAACSNVFTKRHKVRASNAVHGHYECYRNSDGNLVDRMFNENGPVTPLHVYNSGEDCVFSAPKYASLITINAVGGGGNGGEQYGGAAGEFVSLFLSTTNEKIYISPGTAPPLTSTFSATPTSLYTMNAGGTKNEFIKVRGGRSGGNQNIAFRSCSVAGTKYTGCGISPVCKLIPEAYPANEAVNRGAVSISFCVADTSSINSYKTVLVPYYGHTGFADSYFAKYDNCSTADVDARTAHDANRSIAPICNAESCAFNDMSNLSTKLKAYTFKRFHCNQNQVEPYLKDFVTINLEFDGNYTPHKQDSEMDSLINSLGLSGGIADKGLCYDSINGVDNGARCRLYAGSGAPINSRGGNGSVLISW